MKDVKFGSTETIFKVQKNGCTLFTMLVKKRFQW